VVAFQVNAVAWLMTVTFAAGMTAPDLSETVPEIRPLLF
jgi:hypothetical protein